ncbi:MAG: zf-HC2 domain-containing protein [Anaerolineae bacterium]|nr:zf-HC2 domain-containing protein [Anaerolineae bacterium]
MKRGHVDSELLAYLDGMLSEADRRRVEAHLSVCAGCAAELERLRALRVDLQVAFHAVLTPVHLSREATSRIRDELRSRTAHPSWRRSLCLRWGGLAQVALALLVLIFAVPSFLRLQDVAPTYEAVILGQERFVPGAPAALRVIVRDIASATPIPDAAVAVRIGKPPGLARTVFTGRTGAGGTAEVIFMVPEDLEGETDLVVETETATGTGRIVRPIIIARSAKILLTPDKPAYRPGQTVQLRALCLDAADFRPVAGAAVVFEVVDDAGQRIFRESRVTSDYGVAFAGAILPPDAGYGTYTLRATLNETVSERTVLVAAYELPAFRLTAAPDATAKQAGDTVMFVGEARYFFGKPVSDARVSLVAVSPSAPEIVLATASAFTGRDGTFSVAVRPPPDFGAGMAAEPLDFDITVEDVAGQMVGIRRTVWVAGQSILIRAVPESGVLKPGVENELYLLATYVDGAPVSNAHLRVAIAGQRWQLMADPFGMAALRFVPGEGSVPVEVWASPEIGEGEGYAAITLGIDRSPRVLLLHTGQAAAQVGETLGVAVLGGGLPDGASIYLDVIREQQLVSVLTASLVAGRATFALDIDPALVGTLHLHGYAWGEDGAVIEDSRWVVVDRARNLHVEVSSAADVYRPGEIAAVALRVTQEEAPVAAVLGLSIVDASLTALETYPPGFARQQLLLAQRALEDSGNVDVLDASQTLAAQAAWAGAPPPDYTIEENLALEKRAIVADRVLIHLLSAVLTVLPLLLAMVIVPGLAAPASLRLALQRVSWGILGAVLGAPVTAVLLGGGLWLAWSVLGLGALLIAASAMTGLLVVILVLTWLRRDIRIQVTLGGLAAYLLLATLLVLLVARTDSLAPVGLPFIVLSFLLLVGMVALLGQGLIVEGRRGLGWLVTLLALLLIPLVVLLSFVPSLQSDLTAALGSPALYTGPLGWLTGCAPVPSYAPEAPTSEPEVPAETEEIAPPTPLPTALPLPTPTAPVALPVPFPVRQIFPETLYWNPEAVAGTDGQLVLEVPLGDAVTTWRVVALASDRDGSLGVGTYDLPVFQDFFVEVALPADVKYGEPVTGVLVVYNYGERSQAVRWQFAPSAWYTLLTSPEALIVEGNGGIASTPFALRPESLGRFALQITAEGTSRGDTVVIPVEVR